MSPDFEHSSYRILEASVLDDPAISFWLKRAIAELGARDPVDACRDAELLLAVARKRCDQVSGSASRTSDPDSLL